MQLPEVRRPALAGAGFSKDVHRQEDFTKIAQAADCGKALSVPFEVRARVRIARGLLLSALFALDDHGLVDHRLNAITDHTSRLLCRWAGRVPPMEAHDMPTYFAETACQWRQDRDRRERGRRWR